MQQAPGPADFQPGPSLVERVCKAVTDFSCQLSSAHSGALSQVWLPEVDQDGSIILNTQGLPYAINGTGDLLALFRCISCKYKFSTDLTKPHLMGAVGRVFTSNEPEMSHNVQQYDKSVFMRVAEAQRCRVSSALFMPLFSSPKRDCALGVFEVVQTQSEVLFPAVVDWLRCCLREVGLYTADVDKNAFTMGLRPVPQEYHVSAFESGTAAALHHQQRHLTAEGLRLGNGSVPAALGAMGPPPLPLLAQQGQREQAAAALPPQAAAGGAAAQANSDATQSLGAAPAAARAGQLGEEADGQGETLMGSSGQVDAQGTRKPAQEQQQQQQQQAPGERPPSEPRPMRPDSAQQPEPAAAPAAIAAAAVAAGEEEDDGEDEVMQPAKPLLPEPATGPCSLGGARVESSGGPTSGEGTAGVGSHNLHRSPSLGLKRDAQEGSGRGSNPSGASPLVPPGGAGSPCPAKVARVSDGGSLPVNVAAAATAANTAAGGLDSLLGPGSGKLERVGTSAHLTELERRRRQQELVGGGRPGSAPPPGSGVSLRELPSGDLASAAAVFAASPELQARGMAGASKLSSAEATSLNQPIAAALAALLAQQQQQAGGGPGPIGLPTPQSGRALGPDEQQALLLSAAAAAAAATGQLPSPRLPPGAPGLPPRAVQPAAVLPGGTLTTLQPPPPQPPFGSTAPSAADLARLGSGSAADLARLNSGGVGQKNLTIDDLKPHFGYGLKEAASRLGICPTTLKRTCRRLGISRWPRRQLVRLTKQQLAAAKLGSGGGGSAVAAVAAAAVAAAAAAAGACGVGDELRPPSGSDGSGSGGTPGQLGVGQGPTQQSLLANPALLLALQQAQQGGGGDSARAGAGTLLSSPSLHQRLLQLQQGQQAQQGGAAQAGPNPRLNADQLLTLQQQLAAAAAAAAGPSGNAQQPTPGQGSAALTAVGGSVPLFARPSMGGGPSGFPGAGAAGGGLLGGLPRLPSLGTQWEQQQQQQQLGAPKTELFMNGSSQQQPDRQPPPSSQALLGHPGPGMGGLGGGFGGGGGWPQLGNRPSSTPAGFQQGDFGRARAGPAAAVQHAAGNLHHHHEQQQQQQQLGAVPGRLGGLNFGQLQRRLSPTPPLPNGLSLGSVPHFGGDHPQESLDLLAAADFDSVGPTSPPGVSHLGGLSNLGLSNLGVSNLELPGGGGIELSVGAYPGATSSQRQQ